MSLPLTMSDENEVEVAPEDAHEPDPRTVGNHSHTDSCDPAGAEGDGWDLLDLEWRAEEVATLDAHERGLILA